MYPLLPARIVLFAILAHLSSLASAATCYVNFAATGTNAGTSWANAYTDLQSALANYPTCTEVWVARGTYKPTAATDRTVSFNVKPGVIVYGGFNGTEATLAARLLPANPTVLSGDIGVVGDSSDNSYHVVVIDGTTAGGPVNSATLLSDLTISGGNANGADTNQGNGGGLLCKGSGAGHDCSPELANLIFENNSAQVGGAIYDDGHGSGGSSSPVLHDMIIRNNQAPGGAGGGMYNEGAAGGTSGPVIERVTFAGNSADLGGAIYDHGIAGNSNPTLRNSTFYANTASLGGAMLNYAPSAGHASPLLRYVTFYGNKATGGPGAAIYNIAPDGDAAPNISGVIFWADEATGLPVENYVFSQTISSMEFTITTECQVGAVGCIDADPLLGPLQDNDGFAPTLKPDVGSPAIGNGNVVNCPAVDERGISRPQPVGGQCDIGAVELLPAETRRCYVNGAPHAVHDGLSWATAYPLLGSALSDTNCREVWVAKGTYHVANILDTVAFFILPGKAVYGGFAGTETARSQRDPAHNEAILDGQTFVYHVVVIDATGNATNVSGSTILDGFTITGGKANGSEINQFGGGLVCNGNSGYTCNPTLANLVFKNNSAVDGGALFDIGTAGGMSSPSLRAVTFSANHASNAGGAVFNAGGGGVSSPTFTKVDFTGNSAEENGGAMYNQGGAGGICRPSVVASHFDGNLTSTGFGGAVVNDAANASFTDVTFSENHANGGGGAVYNNDVHGPANVQFTSVTFTGNDAPVAAGAVFNDLHSPASQARFDHVTFQDNIITGAAVGGAVNTAGNAVFRDVLFARNGGAAQRGGAIANFGDLTVDGASFVGNNAFDGGAVANSPLTGGSATALISNATFWKNTASGNGGAIYNGAASIALRNVTFGGNVAYAGGALADLSIESSTSGATISNAIFWGDSAGSGAEIDVGAGSTAAIDHSIVQTGCPAGATCSTLSSADPLLGLFQLYGGFTPALMPAANSPALDNGANCPATDQRGVARPQGAACDIGAVERRAVEDYLFNNGFDW